MNEEYIEREAAKRELLSWAVCMNHPEYLMRDDAMHVIDSFPAADVVEAVKCMDIRIIHYKDGVYDVYDRTRDKWLFSSNSSDNVFTWLGEQKYVCVEFIDELLSRNMYVLNS